ncbi:MAG TPA: TRAFs-binding domain-containing protein [Pyrinomonadaceae bacterium]|nr:TRAFs-binding domain-containing protein [Pyrinomonadaceae bacterium]
MPEGTAAQVSGTCFVVMGFGKKTDFETGRILDLDKTYGSIIKPAVEEAGLKCVRANEIVHSGVIDVSMYEQLLKADVVVADLSTSNKNAYYELGVRHALRPYTTIIICEDGVQTFPFDVNHIAIRQYHHLGEGIDFDEVMRFREVLKDAIVKIYKDDPRPKDSPVYTFLHDLAPPALAEAMQSVARAVAATAPDADGRADEVNYSERMQEVDEAQEAGDFVTAKVLLTQLRRKMKEAARTAARKAAEDAAKLGASAELKERPEDPSIIQRLALATYKSKQPTPLAALEEARELLKTLDPATSNDTETLGLWGAVHKRLWEETGDRTHLDEAVRGYERGFYLRNDYYNGINLAYLLNVRAANAPRRAEAVADFVQAERVRREVLDICKELTKDGGPPGNDQKYWALATMAEAMLGVGDEVGARQKLDEASAVASGQWMKESTQEQLDKLRRLLADSPLKYVKADGE